MTKKPPDPKPERRVPAERGSDERGYRPPPPPRPKTTSGGGSALGGPKSKK